MRAVSLASAHVNANFPNRRTFAVRRTAAAAAAAPLCHIVVCFNFIVTFWDLLFPCQWNIYDVRTWKLIFNQSLCFYLSTHTHNANRPSDACALFFCFSMMGKQQQQNGEINYLQRFCSSGFYFGRNIFPIKSHVSRCSRCCEIFAPNALHFLPWICSSIVIGFCTSTIQTKFDTVHQVFQVFHRKRLRIHWKVSSVVTQRNGFACRFGLPIIFDAKKLVVHTPSISSKLTVQISSKCFWFTFNGFNDLFNDSTTIFICINQTNDMRINNIQK